MFGKKKNSINKVVVSSKEELKTAIKRKEPYIEVQGDLAKKMKWMGKLSSVTRRCWHTYDSYSMKPAKRRRCYFAGRWRINC